MKITTNCFKVYQDHPFKTQSIPQEVYLKGVGNIYIVEQLAMGEKKNITYWDTLESAEEYIAELTKHWPEVHVAGECPVGE